jgi:uncharacterized membrane protein
MCLKHVAKGEKHVDDERSESEWPVKSRETKEEINNHSQDKRVITTYEIKPEMNTVLGYNRLKNSNTRKTKSTMFPELFYKTCFNCRKYKTS